MSDVLTQLGLAIEVADGDLISDAVLVMKVHRPSGEVYVSTRSTDGTDWVTTRALVAVAADVNSGGYSDARED